VLYVAFAEYLVPVPSALVFQESKVKVRFFVEVSVEFAGDDPFVVLSQVTV
jgi:hypothetical protein